jgi:ATP-dependent Clp protease ATP-binding subunit ClpC
MAEEEELSEDDEVSEDEDEELSGARVETLLRSIGTIVEQSSLPDAIVTASRIAPLDAIVSALQRATRRSVIVVGERGLGKSVLTGTALKRDESRDRLIFRAGAAEVMAGQMFIGMMEGRVQEIVGCARARPVVWLLPNLEEALFAGQHMQSPHGLLDALLPHVESGALTILAEIDDRAFEQLVVRRPKVLDAFEVVRVPQIPPNEALQITRSWAEQEDLEVADDLLREAIDLSEHYLPGLVAPGNVLRLLKAVVGDNRSRELTPGTLTSTLTELTGLPLRILDPRTPLSIDEARAALAGKVLGQPAAVECLVERVAMIKAGLTDPTRPFGVFLFVGPTGTGKTELAKALAAYLFGSEDRLVRLDMSEFQTPESLERLLAETTPHEAPSAGFVSAISRQPFSIVLLDEFEKAHRHVWDVFLQVFDDGRLTTQLGRTVDFRHTVIILTSNLGSSLRAGHRPGFAREDDDFAAGSVERAVQQAFRPEFLNRLDRIVVFNPLEREIMRSLLEKELRALLDRRGFRMQPWAVEWDEAAIDLLIEKGFSADLGARPLKRAIERHLLAPLSLTIAERNFPEGEQFLLVGAENGSRIRVRFVDPDVDEALKGPAKRADDELTLQNLALDPLGSSEEISFLTTELERISERVRRWEAAKDDFVRATHDPAFWEADERHELLARIEYLDRLIAATRTAERLGARLHPSGGGRRTAARDLIQLLASRLHVLDHACVELERGDPSDAVLSVSATDTGGTAAEFVQSLVKMYSSWAHHRGMLLEPASERNGLRFSVSGLAAYAILAGEHGLHVLEQPVREREFHRIAVRVNVEPVPVYQMTPPPSAHSAPSAEIVRRYRLEPSPLVRDRHGWRTGRADRVLAGDFDLFAGTD